MNIVRIFFCVLVTSIAMAQVSVTPGNRATGVVRRTGPPDNPQDGDMWYDSTAGSAYMRVFGTTGKIGPQTVNTGNKTVFIGDSITAGSGATGSNGWVRYAVVVSKGSINLLKNSGVGGNTTTQMLARFDADVLSLGPDKVVILGGTNDIPSLLASMSNLATVRSNLLTMVRKAKASGVQPIIGTIPPKNVTGPTHAAVSAINAAVRKIATDEKIPCIDFNSILVDPATDTYKSGYDSGDGVHPSNSGHIAMANEFVSKTSGMYVVNEPIIATSVGDGLNLVANPLFLTPGTGLPTGWQTTVGAGTGTVSTVTGDTSVVGNWFQYVLDPGTVGTTYKELSPTVTITTGWAIGDRIAYAARFKTTGLGASGGGFLHVKAASTTSELYRWPHDVDGMLSGVYTVAPTGVTYLLPRFQMYAGTSAWTLQIGQVTLVNLTALGL